MIEQKFPFGKSTHRDGDFHSRFRGGIAEIRTIKGDGLSSLTRDRDANQVAVANNAVGWVEFDPARAREVDLTPGVG